MMVSPRRAASYMALTKPNSIMLLSMYQVQSEILQSVDVEDIESALRGCLLKLQYANASLGPCKEGKPSPEVIYRVLQHMRIP